MSRSEMESIPDWFQYAEAQGFSAKKEEPVVQGIHRVKPKKRDWQRAESLDLHQLQVREALVSLDSFLALRREKGDFGVRIVTGKGLHSAMHPVLPQAVSEHLTGHPLVSRVQTAPGTLGGSGALLVLFKA